MFPESLILLCGAVENPVCVKCVVRPMLVLCEFMIVSCLLGDSTLCV